MSVYTFLASDSPFETLIRPKPRFYTYEEAQKLGIVNRITKWSNYFDEFYEAESEIKCYVNIDEQHELQIIPSDVLGSSYGAHGCIPC